MTVGDPTRPVVGALTPRFLLVSYLPVCVAALYPLILVWGGAAPGRAVSFHRAWRTAAGLGVGEIVLLLFGVVVLGFLVQPLQRGLHGVWRNGPPGPLRARALRRVRARRGALRAAAGLPPGVLALPADQRQAAALTAWQASAALRLGYPPEDHQLRATRLGNLLAALDATAGAGQGWDAAVAWPRLYPVLPDRTRLLVDDARDALDQTLTLATLLAATAVAGAPLLWGSGWWNLLSALPAALSWLSYRAARQAADGYARVVHSAFDLHRFDLLRALHLELPADSAQERAQAAALCRSWRFDDPLTTAYDHPAP